MVEAAFSARLIEQDAAPVAVAFSGGGDSLALLLAAKAWADRRGRRLLALTVDHGLRPESAAWARFCHERAAALGVDHRILVWEDAKPPTGVSAAARDARHRLLANAARSAGAAVILVGHTADDVAEAALMRRTGSSVASPRPWGPSPVWPEGRGIFLMRPLLGVRRATLRATLSTLGERWIDDPGNVDPSSARARARAQIAGAPLAEDASTASETGRDLGVALGAAGDLFFGVDRLIGAPDGQLLLGAALLCAAGTDRPPRREPLGRLMARLRAGERFAATLAGARVECDGARAHIVRDAGDGRRGALTDRALAEARSSVWDGRFEVVARVAGARIGTLAGRAARLPPPLRRALAEVPPAARRALPLVLHGEGALTLPTLRRDPAVEVRPLALARLAAALGAIVNEAGLRRMAKPAPPT